MAELTTNPTPAPDSAGEEYDPLANLHKMSMTAGLGSQDYVAINNTSFAAVVLGLLGVLSLFWPLCLICSGVGLVCAVVAWWQIRSSNGTQTGKGIVAIALLLCLGIGGYVSANSIIASYENKSDTQAIAKLIDQFSQDVTHQDYELAYSLCSADFQQRVSPSKFAETFRTQDRLSPFGALKGIEWNHNADWFGAEANGDKISAAQTLVYFEKKDEPYRQNVSFLKVQGMNGWHWEVNDIPWLFPKPRKSTGPGGMPAAGDAAPEGPNFSQ